MKGQLPDGGREVPRLEVPEDVAVLYAWANLQGARYRDFSASRRESRAQMRQRAAQAQREAEALAKAKAEESAAEAEREAIRAAEAPGLPDAQVRRTPEAEPRQFEGEQAALELGALGDPYTLRPQSPPARVLVGAPAAEEDMRPERFPQRRAPRIMAPLPERRTERGPAAVTSRSLPEEAGTRQAQGEGTASGGSQGAKFLSTQKQLRREQPFEGQADVRTGEAVAAEIPIATPTPVRKGSENSTPLGLSAGPKDGGTAAFVERRSEPRPAPLPEPEERFESAVPAWIHGQDGPAVADPAVRSEGAPSSVVDTLQHSRERVASRWYALRGVFDPATPEMEPTQARARQTASPVLAVFSLAGGVGKTSLTASLGRSLSAVGEKVLLADLTRQGIVAVFFGGTELRPGVVRTFSPPPGSADAPVSMVSHDLLGRTEAREGAEDPLMKELVRGKETFEHVLIDLSPAAATVLKGLAQRDAMVLVPLAPDMNTVISLASMERFFAGMTDSNGRPLQPHYLLTQFEASLPLHLDVREGLRQKLGHRLLPFVIRRSAEVSEALAEGMTVIDYAPESGVAADYRNLASWLRSLAAPTHPETRAARWSER